MRKNIELGAPNLPKDSFTDQSLVSWITSVPHCQLGLFVFIFMVINSIGNRTVHSNTIHSNYLWYCILFSQKFWIIGSCVLVFYRLIWIQVNKCNLVCRMMKWTKIFVLHYFKFKTQWSTYIIFIYVFVQFTFAHQIVFSGKLAIYTTCEFLFKYVSFSTEKLNLSHQFLKNLQKDHKAAKTYTRAAKKRKKNSTNFFQTTPNSLLDFDVYSRVKEKNNLRKLPQGIISKGRFHCH